MGEGALFDEPIDVIELKNERIVRSGNDLREGGGRGGKEGGGGLRTVRVRLCEVFGGFEPGFPFLYR